MKDSNNSDYPQFIKNDVCGEDLFEGKSHQDTAKAIKNIIVRKDSCNLIGIDGGWGSGKSNLVKLVENEIYSDGNLNSEEYRFFTYDAWGHQEDLQRRSILEELIDDLIIDNKHMRVDCSGNEVETLLPAVLQDGWKSKLEKLLAKRRKNTTETVPKIGVGIIVSALILILTPIASIIASWIPASCIAGKLLATASPLLIGAIYLYCKAKCNLKKREEGVTIGNVLVKMFLLYKDEVKTNTTYENISEKEPSSREFKKWMSEIDFDLAENTLVLIFDNMDRLPKAKVQELWATIHTFFADVNYCNIKVIVPFDRAHIISAFKAEDTNDGSSNETPNNICYGDDYINKTFDVIFRVAPPTMSNWRDYFSGQWEKVFGDVVVDNRTLQIFDANTTLLTPRKINAFINELASIKQMGYASDIPCDYIALFIYGKSKISKNPSVEVLNPTYIDNSVKYLYEKDQELSKYVSALYYQLTPDKAMDIVTTEALRKALDTGGSEYIDSIKESTAFNHILANSIPRIKAIPNAVTVLSNNDKCTTEDWADIYSVLQSDESDELKHRKLQTYQTLLLVKLKGKNQTTYLKDIISHFYDGEKTEAVQLSKDIVTLSKALGNESPYDYLNDINVSPENFVNFVKETKEEWSRYKIRCEQKQLDKYFELFTVENVSFFDIYEYIKDGFDLSKYKERLNELVDEHASDAEGLAIIYGRIKEFSRPIEKILSEVELHNLRSGLVKKGPFFYDIICMHISRFVNVNAAYTRIFAEDVENTDSSFVTEVAKRIECYVDYGKLLLQLNSSSTALHNAIVQDITENEYGVSSMDIVKVLSKYDTIITASGILPQVLIARFNDWVRFAKQKVKTDNINTIPLKFFEDVVANAISNELTKHCNTVAIQNLNNLSKEDWIDSIQNNKRSFQLLKLLTPKLPAKAIEAFSEMIMTYVRGDDKTVNNKNVLAVITMAQNEKRGLVNLFKSVRHAIISRASINAEMFKFYGGLLFEYGKLNEDKGVLAGLFTPQIIGNDECLGVILQYREKMISVVTNAPEDESMEFKENIQNVLNEGNYNTEIGFESFANAINIFKEELQDNADENA